MSVLTIKVGYMPGQLKEYGFEAPVTVKEILAEAEMDSTGYDIKLDGRTVELDTVVNSGRVLALTKRVKGN